MKDSEIIKNWKNSAKYAEFQYRLNEAKQKAFEIKSKMFSEENIHSTSDAQLNSFIEILKELNNHFEDDDQLFDYNYFSILGNQDDIILEYLQKQKVLFIYLKRSLSKENYELSANIRDAIQMEKNLIVHLIEKYRPEIVEHDDMFFYKISLIDEEFYKLINEELGN